MDARGSCILRGSHRDAGVVVQLPIHGEPEAEPFEGEGTPAEFVGPRGPAADAVRDVVGEVEDRYAVAVDTVVVGDCIPENGAEALLENGARKGLDLADPGAFPAHRLPRDGGSFDAAAHAQIAHTTAPTTASTTAAHANTFRTST